MPFPIERADRSLPEQRGGGHVKHVLFYELAAATRRA